MADRQNGAFEQKIARLEAIVKELETGNIELDKSVALFQEGRALADECEALLKGAQEQISRAMQQPAAAAPKPEDEDSDDIPF